MFVCKAVICLLLCTTVIIAQQSGQRGRRPYPPNGKLVAEVMPSVMPMSLRHLISISDLVVDGTVVAPLPTINWRNDSEKPLLETHSVIAVQSVLSGSIPNKSATILLAQGGGNDGRWDVRIADDRIVVPNERYIFFLFWDERKERPNHSGYPRYTVVGVWAGKAQVLDGKVQFLPAAHPELHKHDNSDVETFLQTVREAIITPMIPDAHLPIHPSPPEPKP